MAGRRYDYAAPIFGGDFCVAPPPLNASPDTAYRSLVKQSSISQQSSLNRADSGSRNQFTRTDSYGTTRSPLSRGNSTSSRTTTETSYSTTSGGGRPTSFSTTSYKSPYGNNYRSFSKY